MAEEQPTSSMPADAPWWARWLDENIKEAWKWASMRWPAVCAAAAEVYALDPKGTQDFIKSVVPASWWPHIVAMAFVASMFFRAWRQKGASK